MAIAAIQHGIQDRENAPVREEEKNATRCRTRSVSQGGGGLSFGASFAVHRQWVWEDCHMVQWRWHLWHLFLWPSTSHLKPTLPHIFKSHSGTRTFPNHPVHTWLPQWVSLFLRLLGVASTLELKGLLCASLFFWKCRKEISTLSSMQVPCGTSGLWRMGNLGSCVN